MTFGALERLKNGHFDHFTLVNFDTKRCIWKSAGQLFFWNSDIFLYRPVYDIIAHNFHNLHGDSITDLKKEKNMKENIHFYPKICVLMKQNFQETFHNFPDFLLFFQIIPDNSSKYVFS
jgi:hypothetical protein